MAGMFDRFSIDAIVGVCSPRHQRDSAHCSQATLVQAPPRHAARSKDCRPLGPNASERIISPMVMWDLPFVLFVGGDHEAGHP